MVLRIVDSTMPQEAAATILPYFAVLLCARESGGMADALDLGSSAARRAGSSPASRTSYN